MEELENNVEIIEDDMDCDSNADEYRMQEKMEEEAGAPKRKLVMPAELKGEYIIF